MYYFNFLRAAVLSFKDTKVGPNSTELSEHRGQVFFWTDQLTLSKLGGGRSCPPHYYSPTPPDFQAFLRPCTKSNTPSSFKSYLLPVKIACSSLLNTLFDQPNKCKKTRVSKIKYQIHLDLLPGSFFWENAE